MKNGKKSKTRMGRPPQKVSEVLSEIVCIRLTKSERHLVETEARKLGISVKGLLMLLLQQKEG